MKQLKIYPYLKYIFSIFFILLFNLNNSNAQSKLDSLDTLLSSHVAKKGEDTLTLSYLRKLYELSKENKPYLALEYAGQALQASEKLRDSLSLADWHDRIADVYFDQKVFYLAMQSYFDSYKIYNALGYRKKATYSQVSIGDTYLTQNVDDIAVDYYKKALQTFKDIKDNSGIALTLNKIGLINLKQFNYDYALKNFDEALNLGDSIHDLNSVALTYTYKAEAYKQLEDYEKAIGSLSDALMKYKIVNDKVKVAEIYFSIGDIYIKMEDYEKAKEAYEKALNIFQELGVEVSIAETLNKIGNIYFITDKYTQALSFASKALEIANDNGLLSQKRDAYFLFSNIYSQQGNIKLAYEYHKKYSVVKDSIWDSKKQEQFTELQVSLETQKKEKEIEILKKDKAIQDNVLRRKQTENYALFASVIIFSLFGFFIFRSNRKIRHANQLLQVQYEEINQQKQEIMTSAENLEFANKEITNQKNDIEAKSKKITSSITYASRIQKSMLPNVEKIMHSFTDCFVLFSPKEAVSGDFYWFSNVVDANGNTKSIIAAIDCTGHGVPGAFMSVMADAYLNQIVNFQHFTSPDKILNELHKNIRIALQQEENENNDGMDIALCVVDRKLKILEFAGAKNPLVYMQNGKVNRVNGNLMSLGGLQKEKERIFTKHTIDISVPTCFYIFSDGFQDQLGGELFRKFMAQNLRQLLFDNHKLPFAEQKIILESTLQKWMGENKQNDDIMILGVKI